MFDWFLMETQKLKIHMAKRKHAIKNYNKILIFHRGFLLHRIHRFPFITTKLILQISVRRLMRCFWFARRELEGCNWAIFSGEWIWWLLKREFGNDYDFSDRWLIKNADEKLKLFKHSKKFNYFNVSSFSSPKFPKMPQQKFIQANLLEY